MDAVASIHSIPLRSEMLRPQQVSTGSLYGMENAIRPRANISINFSPSDFDTPLPSVPAQPEDKNRTSSVYSTDINDLIDSYLSAGSDSSSDSLDSPRFDQYHHLSYVPDASRFCHDGRFSASETFISTIPTRQDYTESHDQPLHDDAKHRYSNPEPRSPDILELRTHGLWDDEEEGLSFEKSIKEYRDTLLPAPFTPISITSPGLCHDVVPLRGPRSARPPALEETSGYFQPRIPFASSRDTLQQSPTRSSTASTRVPDESASQTFDPVVLHEKLSYVGHKMTHFDASDQDRVSPLYISSANSSSSRMHVAKVRPAPWPYPDRKDSVPSSNPIRSSSYSGFRSSQPFSGNDATMTLPRNWSPRLKASNPDIPRVPLSERSPAIGLSDYQIVGSKAWKGDEYEESRQGVVKFWAKRNRPRHSARRRQSLDLDDNRDLPSSELGTFTQRNISNVSSPSELLISSSLRDIDGINSSRRSDPTLTTNQIKSPAKQSKFSPSKLNFSRLNPWQDSKETTKGMSWPRSRKQKVSIGDTNMGSGNMKDKIVMLSARGSMDSFRGSSPSDRAAETPLPSPASQDMFGSRWI